MAMSHQTIIVSLGLLIVIILGLLIKTPITEAPITNPNLSLSTLTRVIDGEKVVLNINNAPVTAEIARSAGARSRGLSGRASLNPNQGMLFVFPSDTRPGFWMKEMNFTIDIVWIDSHGTVVGIISHLKPDSYPQKFYPSQPIRYVLELPAGLADQLQLKTGDIIHLNA